MWFLKLYHHHIRVNQEIRMDLKMWKVFLNHPSVFCPPFMHFDETVRLNQLFFYTDASGSVGMGGICNQDWMHMQWDSEFIRNKKPTIQYLELYALLAAVLAWTQPFKNKYIEILCDNENACRAVNDLSTSCKNCMILIRILVLHCLTLNMVIKVTYVKSAKNDLADSLSRGKLLLFKQLAKERELEFNKEATPVPKILLPMQNVWMN